MPLRAVVLAQSISILPLFTKFRWEERSKIIWLKTIIIKKSLNLNESIKNIYIFFFFFIRQIIYLDSENKFKVYKVAFLRHSDLSWRNFYLLHQNILTWQLFWKITIYSKIWWQEWYCFTLGNLFDVLIEDSWILTFFFLQSVALFCCCWSV